MRRCGLIFAVVAATCLAIGCGSTAVENPAAPSPQYPSLLGEWRDTGLLTLTAADGSSFGRHGCPSFWTVKSQDGGNFSGTVAFGSNGLLSLRLCPYYGSFSGTLEADGTVTLRIDPPLRQGCSHVAGDGTFTGRWWRDGTMSIETTEAVTCLNVLIPNPPTQQAGTRTITFRWWRPTDWSSSRNNLGTEPAENGTIVYPSAKPPFPGSIRPAPSTITG